MTSSSRHQVVHDGRVIYEWSQDIDEINCWISPPPGIRAAHIDCVIDTNKIRLGIKGNPPYIDEQLGGICNTSDSLWMIEDGVIHITLAKSVIGSVWASFSCGPASSSLNSDEISSAQRAILLERFQRENPNFDFSSATISGQTPDPTEFMGGINKRKLQ